MLLTEKIFGYCERGLDPGLFAEPLNAVSNAMFFVAAAYGWWRWQARPAGDRGWLEFVLVLLVTAIAIGSTLFHTFATRWAAILDVGPIALFMLTYVGFTVSRLFGGRPLVVTLAMVAFVAVLALAGQVRCGGTPCVAGSLGYVPAFLAILAVGIVLTRQGHAAGPAMLAAAAIFGVALTARTLDRPLCPMTIVAGRTLGLHALWHLLNGVLLLVLLRIAFDTGKARRGTPLAPVRRPV